MSVEKSGAPFELAQRELGAQVAGRVLRRAGPTFHPPPEELAWWRRQCADLGLTADAAGQVVFEDGYRRSILERLRQARGMPAWEV